MTLFVSHHLDKLDAAYWKQHAGTPRPTPTRVLDLLVLSSHWGAERNDGLEAFDFTLPDDVTDYVISVRFNELGGVESIKLES